jgi:serine/threonine protein kinase
MSHVGISAEDSMCAKTPPNPSLPQLRLEGTGDEIFDIGSQYTTRLVIGKGAFGYVIAAECTATGNKVAIKKVKSAMSDRVGALRLLREVRFLRQLRGHPNVITLVDVLLSDGDRQVPTPLTHTARPSARDGAARRSWTCTS